MKIKDGVEWCKHIHNWGNDFYFVDSFHPFAVSEFHSFWEVCPICKTERPKENGHSIKPNIYYK